MKKKIDMLEEDVLRILQEETVFNMSLPFQSECFGTMIKENGQLRYGSMICDSEFCDYSDECWKASKKKNTIKAIRYAIEAIKENAKLKADIEIIRDSKKAINVLIESAKKLIESDLK